MLLYELSTSVTKLNGVGPAAAADLHNLGVHTIRDLLWLLPREYEDRQQTCPLIPQAGEHSWINTTVEIIAHDYFLFQGKHTLKIYVRDSEGQGCLVCFGRNFLARKLTVGSRHFLCGWFSVRYGDFQCSAFDSEPVSDSPRLFGRILPIYPLSGSLQQGRLRNLMQQAISHYGEQLDPSIPAKPGVAPGVVPTTAALRQVHLPPDMPAAEQGRAALAYEELFFMQARIALAVTARAQLHRPPPKRPPGLLQQLVNTLPFALTPDQRSSIDEIRADLCGTVPMRRLLHGDVGSGKTLVAICSALPVLEGGGQTVLLVPTELLAQQHLRTISALFAPLGIACELLCGSLSASRRREVLAGIQSGSSRFICATHAAFSRDVQYSDLQYIIVDEQHRFGVEQRQALIEKAGKFAHTGPDVLFMTATPIPRTLALTVFGDLQVSAITTMPPGRLPVLTHLARHGNEQKVYDWVRGELNAGRQAYFVYPLIRESSKLSIRDVESMAHYLKESVFPEFAVGVIHSETPVEQKEQIMQGFAQGSIQILAATSVIEVGVDVPNATCMVIEHAERFGLAALHQLRGRVGRGVHQSYCFLVYSEPLTEDAKQRLKVMKEHNDGFRIAEEDLNIRGPGDLAGIRQAGFLRLRAARLPQDMDIMNTARSHAFTLIQQDPQLEKAEHAAVRTALHMLEIEGDT